MSILIQNNVQYCMVSVLTNQLHVYSLPPLVNAILSYTSLIFYDIYKYDTCGRVSSMSASPHITMETHLQHRFSVNIWCHIIRNHLTGPCVIADYMTAAYYLNSFRTHSYFCYKTSLCRQGKNVVSTWWCASSSQPTHNMPLSYLLDWLFWSMYLACKVTRSHASSLRLVGHWQKSQTREELLQRIMSPLTAEGEVMKFLERQ